jgi:predicted DNA-binding transcriptional regulator YafY
VFKRRWYLLGKYGNGKLKIYALDRMQNVDIEFNQFELPKDFSAEAFFSTCFGIIVGDKEPQSIKLKVAAQQADYLRTLPLHPSQKVVEQTKDYTIFSYFLRITYDLRQEILTLGDTVEVLYPKELRKTMADICKKMAKQNK